MKNILVGCLLFNLIIGCNNAVALFNKHAIDQSINIVEKERGIKIKSYNIDRQVDSISFVIFHFTVTTHEGTLCTDCLSLEKTHDGVLIPK
jgi:hypothetical protein